MKNDMYCQGLRGRESDGKFAVGKSLGAAKRLSVAEMRRRTEQRAMVAEAIAYGNTTVKAIAEYIEFMFGKCEMQDSEIEVLMI